MPPDAASPEAFFRGGVRRKAKHPPARTGHRSGWGMLFFKSREDQSSLDLDTVGAAFVHKEQHAGQRDSQTGQNSEQYFQKFHGQTLLNGMRPGHGVRPELC